MYQTAKGNKNPLQLLKRHLSSQVDLKPHTGDDRKTRNKYGVVPKKISSSTDEIGKQYMNSLSQRKGKLGEHFDDSVKTDGFEKRKIRILETTKSNKKIYDENFGHDKMQEDSIKSEHFTTVSTVTQLRDTFGCDPELIKQLG